MTEREILQKAKEDGRWIEVEPKRDGNPFTPVYEMSLTDEEREIIYAEHNLHGRGCGRRDTFDHKNDTSARKA
jgi:hypothetical protein